MPKKILVIDDNDGILDAFKAMLESEGYEVTIAQNTKLLKSLSKKKFPDLIFLDILLSGDDGRKICKTLKKNKKTSNIPIIMMSAAPDMENSAKEASADDFLKKPFEMDEILIKIKKYIN